LPLHTDCFANDCRLIALSEGVGVELPNKKTPAAVEETLTGPANGETILNVLVLRPFVGEWFGRCVFDFLLGKGLLYAF
jgi:hypothetical protein